MIPFSPPRIDQKIIDEVTDTLKSGWITTGPKTKLLEKKITNYCGNKTTLCVSSATAGLEVILRWFGISKDDEVIIPAYTYCATANVVLHCGARPVMVDINKDDFNISIQNIRKAITSKTKVIIPVDLGGYPCDYDDIMNLVKDKDILSKFTPANEIQKKLGRILILSDAAHSLGAVYKNRKTGSLCDITVFSFHAVKNLTTAEGGAIALNLEPPFDNNEIYKFLNIFVLHGQSKDALSKTQKGAWKYDVINAGYKANMTDVLASIGLIEIDRYDTDTLKQREEIFNFYNEKFLKYDWAQVPVSHNKEKKSCFHAYFLRIKNINENQRDNIIQAIFDKDVAVNIHFQPLPLLSHYKSLGYRIEDFPVAYENYSQEISLPVFYDLTKEQMEIVVNSVVKSVNEIL